MASMRSGDAVSHHRYRLTHPIGPVPAASQPDSSPTRGTSPDPPRGSLRPEALRSRSQVHRSQGWYGEAETVRVACPRLVAGPDLAVVADVATCVQAGVGVQALAPRPARRHSGAVVVPRHRCEVAHHRQHVVRVATLAQEGKDTVL